ncbi:DUF58 domain-containing protein [Fodinicola feengrottensis]|uniref:DUF58 domain-containing protein n=1 Tax=Fodinicola feengrottensis TaxID=435914 RepID=UPI0013D6DEE3|nr:DUF58 domain-containing protein [Fodinicola feengrottensis]
MRTTRTSCRRTYAEKHLVGPLTLDRQDALGLGHSRVSTGATATLWVLPRTLPMRAMSRGRLRLHYDGAATPYSLRGSMDLREVRPYVPGDEVRHLHWKATAKTGQLMVREYVDPNQPRFTVLLDSRSETMPAHVFEDAVDVAASLVISARFADYGCRLLTTCGIDSVSRPGARALGRRMLDELCLLGRGSDSAAPLVPDRIGGREGGGLTLVVAALTAADRAARVAAVRSTFATVVVIALGSTEIAPIAGVSVLRAATADEAADRWNTAVTR